MNKIKILSFIIVITMFVLTSCEPTIDTAIGTGNKGNLVSSNESINYVAIGNSISAGYQDGSVYSVDGGNVYSFPALLAKTFGMTTFNQPVFQGDGFGAPRLKFYGFDATGSPIIKAFLLLNATTSNLNLTQPYHNLGVPGALAYDLIDESTNFIDRAKAYSNPYYAYILRNTQFGKTMIDQAINLNPNVVTIEIGANDVLGYATSGGTISTTYVNGKAVPTPSANLTQIYQAAVAKLVAAKPNCKIIVLNVPNVMGVPYFNVVPWNKLELDDTKAAGLNAAYKGLFTFVKGPNGFIAEDPSNKITGMRQLTANDKVLFSVPQDSLKAGWGSLKPIPKKYVLFKEEIDIVNQSVKEYNAAISNLTKLSANVKVFDLDKLFSDILLAGYKVPSSSTMYARFISGEMFSLDGIHPTSRGYGAIANELIKYINSNYNSDFPLHRIQDLPAIIIRQ